jgi:hypothetical protein
VLIKQGVNTYGGLCEILPLSIFNWRKVGT